MESEPTITQRLHVAGLTPSITSKDLHDRFSSFGTVKAVDGLGLLDGVGLPRKFAYVTLEATALKLTRCMNVLSGTTYKGARLRIGDARPDWPTKWSIEHGLIPNPKSPDKPGKRAAEAEAEADADETKAKKKRRLMRGVEGREATDMTPVDVESAKEKQYWHVTALSHLIRPVRMRPLHPLPPLPDSTKPPVPHAAASSTGKLTKRKAKEMAPVKRARRVVIDPTRWGAVHISGELLEVGDVVVPDRVGREEVNADEDPEKLPRADKGKEKKEKKQKKEKRKAKDVESNVVVPVTDAPQTAPLPTGPAPVVERLAIRTSTSTQPADDPILLTFTREKESGLNLLKAMFGDSLEGADKWVDEDLSDVEGLEGFSASAAKQNLPVEMDVISENDESEVILPIVERSEEEEEEAEEAEEDSTEEEEEEADEQVSEASSESDEVEQARPPQHATAATPKNGLGHLAAEATNRTAALPVEPAQETLKDLFAPREDTGGFAFDLDLDDLDDDPALVPDPLSAAPFHLEPAPQPVSYEYQQSEITYAHATDFSSYPLFFPTFNEDGNPVENNSGLGGRGGRGRGRARTFWDVAREKDWDLTEWKRETEEEARERWERVKGQLTVEWKKRSREARRRRKATGLAGVGDTI